MYWSGESSWIDAERAVAIGAECVFGSRIEGGGIHTAADGRSRDNFTGVGIHDSHHFVVAAGEEAAVFGIHGHAGRFFAGRERPAMLHFHCCESISDDFAFVFDVDVDMALPSATANSGFPPSATLPATLPLPHRWRWHPSRPFMVNTRLERGIVDDGVGDSGRLEHPRRFSSAS